jgi:hypothetical protein
LTAGTHVMRVVMDTAGPLGNIGNFDYFQFANAAPTHVINADPAQAVITFARDADGVHTDWTTLTCHGAFPIDDTAGLTLNYGGTLMLDYSMGNPLPDVLHLNGDFVFSGITGPNPFSAKTIDIGDQTAWFSYASDPDLPSAVRNTLKAGYNDGRWNGSAPGGAITSSAVSFATGGRYSVGSMCDTDASNVLAQKTIEVRYTLAGDANLDGVVNSTDAVTLGKNYSVPGCNWAQGDFNYDSNVNYADATILRSNWELVL